MSFVGGGGCDSYKDWCTQGKGFKVGKEWAGSPDQWCTAGNGPNGEITHPLQGGSICTSSSTDCVPCSVAYRDPGKNCCICAPPPGSPPSSKPCPTVGICRGGPHHPGSSPPPHPGSSPPPHPGGSPPPHHPGGSPHPRHPGGSPPHYPGGSPSPLSPLPHPKPKPKSNLAILLGIGGFVILIVGGVLAFYLFRAHPPPRRVGA